MEKNRDVEGLLAELRNSAPDSLMRGGVIFSLSRFRDPRVAIEISKGLLPEGPNYVMATAALARIALPECEPHLLHALDSPSATARSHAAVGLGRIGSRDAKPRLLELLESEEPGEPLTAARALAAIGDPDVNDALVAARRREPSFLLRRRFPKRADASRSPDGQG